MFRATANTAVALVTTDLLVTTMLAPTSASAFYAAREGFAHYAGPRTSMMIRRIPETHPLWHWHLGWRIIIGSHPLLPLRGSSQSAAAPA
jgi:hypothetical protein